MTTIYAFAVLFDLILRVKHIHELVRMILFDHDS